MYFSLVSDIIYCEWNTAPQYLLFNQIQLDLGGKRSWTCSVLSPTPQIHIPTSSNTKHSSHWSLSWSSNSAYYLATHKKENSSQVTMLLPEHSASYADFFSFLWLTQAAAFSLLERDTGAVVVSSFPPPPLQDRGNPGDAVPYLSLLKSQTSNSKTTGSSNNHHLHHQLPCKKCCSCFCFQRYVK